VEEENKKTKTKEKQMYLLLDAAPSAVTADARIFAAVDRHTDAQLIFVRCWDD
jgi:Mrp family chromosome partitioning ATPase